MENNISYAKWKGQLMKLNLVIILALSVLEFGLYFGIRQAGKMYVGFDVYLVKYIIASDQHGQLAALSFSPEKREDLAEKQELYHPFQQPYDLSLHRLCPQ